MMKRALLFVFSMISMTISAIEPDILMKVNLRSHAADILETLYGVFFEEINHAGEGGLYGELLQNRSFEDKVMPEGYRVRNDALVPFKTLNYANGRVTDCSFKWNANPYPGWEIIKNEGTEASADIVTTDPNFASAPSQMRVDIRKGGVSLVNEGFWGIHFTKGATYRLQMWIKAEEATDGKTIGIAFVDDNGKPSVVDRCKLQTDGKWHKYTTVLTSPVDAKSGKMSIMLGDGTYYFDYVSLFPTDTFKGRENGMRRDVAEMIENLHPAFVRWPGGCIVEGITLNNRVDWKKTLGDPASRPGEYDSWGYRNSYGFGYKEFLDFCEDLGAKALYVCNVGMACTGRSGEYSAEGDIQMYVDDALEAIEYAIGDTSTVWGAVRARQGHPGPYTLTYIEVGNENFGPMYDKRYRIFHDAIKAHYPQLTIISDYGLDNKDKAVRGDMIDPHWYVKPEDFFSKADQFDSYDRQSPDIYIGEYACNDGVGGGCMLAALSEAAFLTGVERNADVVRMASYAPLFENRHDKAWPVNLIWIDNDNVVGRSSYYVQKMFADNRPSYNLDADVKIKAETKRQAFLDQTSYMGLGCSDTKAEFRNISITRGKKSTPMAETSDSAVWAVAKDGHRSAFIWREGRLHEGDIVEFDARSEGGEEQFRFFYGMKRLDLKEGGSHVTFGGWGNTATGVEGFYGENNRWTTVAEQQSEAITPNEWHHVRMAFLADGIDIMMDGKMIFSHRTDIIKRKFCAVGYDKKANEVVIKLVNANQRRCTAMIQLEGAQIELTGKVTELKATSPQAENSYDNPTLIHPVERTYNGFAPSFTYIMPANSVTILRTKIKQK